MTLIFLVLLFTLNCAAQTSLGFAVQMISPVLLPDGGTAVISGDFNGDGKQDVAIPGQQDQALENVVTVHAGL